MADNITLNSGTGGAVVKTDDDGTAHWQYVKIAFGADNTQTRVTAAAPLPVDASGNAVPVTDNSGSLTVDGTVTANLSATDNAVLDNIDADTSAIQTAVELLDDAVVADDAAFTPATTKVVMAGAEFDDTTPDSVDEGDAGALRMSARRELYVQLRDAAGNERGLNVDASGNIGVTDASGSLTVDNAHLTSLGGAISGTEVQVDVVAALPAGTNAIGKLAANSGVDIGDVDVTSIAAGTNLIGDVGISGARTSGGTTPYKNLDVDESEDDVKTSAGQVYWIHAINLTAAPLYLKFYNATAATVVVGTTTPVLTFPVPGNADSDGAGFNLSIPNGIAFGTAICIAATTGFADNDTGAPGANALIVNLGYA